MTVTWQGEFWEPLVINAGITYANGRKNMGNCGYTVSLLIRVTTPFMTVRGNDLNIKTICSTSRVQFAWHLIDEPRKKTLTFPFWEEGSLYIIIMICYNLHKTGYTYSPLYPKQLLCFHCSDDEKRLENHSDSNLHTILYLDYELWVGFGKWSYPIKIGQHYGCGDDVPAVFPGNRPKKKHVSAGNKRSVAIQGCSREKNPHETRCKPFHDFFTLFSARND